MASTHRSDTGNHPLLRSPEPGHVATLYEQRCAPAPFIAWTFERGSVIWRIWPAVLLHTSFAAAVALLTMKGIVDLQIPNVMLTVLGVVIGFVISYRASSGYDRYWMGRTFWSDIMRDTRTLGRLIWFHVPPRVSPKTTEEIASGQTQRSKRELRKVMAEKYLALDLVEGFAVALKHHIRGEYGIYYEDLYHLIKPLHEHGHASDVHEISHAKQSPLSSAPKLHDIATQRPVPRAASDRGEVADEVEQDSIPDPFVPPINTYGTFSGQVLLSAKTHRHYMRRVESNSSVSSDTDSSESQHHQLLPSTKPRSTAVLDKVFSELIPFSGMFDMLRRWTFGNPKKETLLSNTALDANLFEGIERQPSAQLSAHSKRHFALVGSGENLPLEVLRCLSEWMSVLEDRGTVPGTSLGSMMGTISAFEDSLTALERILTTPLPFVYAVHISTVWIYLFFLPFQLVGQFGYYSIPGVAIAAFIYLGFLAAGEEIEQPFGYDENDLNLDLFCREIIHSEIEHLKGTPCLNAYLGSIKPNPRRRRPKRVVELTESTLQELPDDGIFGPMT